MFERTRASLAMIGVVLLAAACGGGGGGDGSTTVPPPSTVTPPAAPTLVLALSAVKTFGFSWSAVTGATSYKLLEDPDGTSGYTAVSAASNLTGTSYDHIVPLYERVNARYVLQACNSAGCTDSAAVNVSGNLVAAIGYGKASNPGAADGFGVSTALSSDGTTLVVGAEGESSNATGIDGNQNDNSATSSGAVYVFTRSGGAWTQQAYLKASNTGVEDFFGHAVALSADGNTLAVGASGESSEAGAVYIFTRTSGTWSQQAYVKASNMRSRYSFGSSISLATDGNTLAVGSPNEASTATGIGGDQTDHSGQGNGAVYVFTRIGGAWSQQAYVKGSNTGDKDYFGTSVSLAADGNTLAVGAVSEDSNATGVGGNQADNSARDSGAVYVFTRTATVWSQQAYIKASNPQEFDKFGSAITLAADGDTLAVGAINEDSGAAGVGGNQSDNLATDSGAVYVFKRTAATWLQEAYLKASNPGLNDSFGSSMSLAVDGNTLAVGAPMESSNGTGVDGTQGNKAAVGAGAVYVFTRGRGGWSQLVYIKAPNTEAADTFGAAVALAADGNTLVAGALGEASNAMGFSGNQSDNSVAGSGAIYVY